MSFWESLHLTLDNAAIDTNVRAWSLVAIVVGGLMSSTASEETKRMLSGITIGLGLAISVLSMIKALF
jgi:hypothetical protein